MAYAVVLDTCVLFGGRVLEVSPHQCHDALGSGLVEGYEPLIELMENDQKDRHVLAAAVRANAAAIVTNNVKDFPPASTAPYGIAVVTADEFVIDQLDLAPGVVMRVLEQQAAAHKRPPYEVEGLLSYLERAGVKDFAAQARRHLPPLA